jgi:predicted XRE-type DNA-binding protein
MKIILSIVFFMSQEKMQLRSKYVNIVKSNLKNSGYVTQEKLARAMRVTQSAVSDAVNGKPVLKEMFDDLCTKLSLPKTYGEKVLESPSVNLDRNIVCRDGEDAWYKELLKHHSLIKIHAPQKFGKNLLVYRMLNREEKASHFTIYLNLGLIDNNSIKESSIFFLRFVTEVALQIEKKKNLEVPISLEPYNRHLINLPPMRACREYLEYLIKNKIGNQPFTLAIDKIDRLVDFPSTGADFLGFLRDAHENSKEPDTRLKNFRLIIAYTTPEIEKYIPMDPNESPFNVGHQIDLPEFTLLEVTELAKIRGLTLSEEEIKKLMRSIGGIPKLIQLALEYYQKIDDFCKQNLATIQQIQDYLRLHEQWLEAKHLDVLMHKICTDRSMPKTELSPKAWRLLYSRGLIIENKSQVEARCELYRDYFKKEW